MGRFVEVTVTKVLDPVRLRLFPIIDMVLRRFGRNEHQLVEVGLYYELFHLFSRKRVKTYIIFLNNRKVHTIIFYPSTSPKGVTKLAGKYYPATSLRYKTTSMDQPPRGSGSARHWCFTINNPVDLDPNRLLANMESHRHFRYGVFQLEAGDSGTPHYQGYIEFKNVMRLRAVATLLTGHPHLEQRQGTRDQARDYCMKEDSRLDGPFEAGEWRNVGQGQRVDLGAATDTLISSKDLGETARAHPREWVRYHRGFESLFTRLQPRRTEPPEVFLFYGGTGTGKTRKAFEEDPLLYRKAPDTKWFDGYESQQTLLLDDFSGASSKMSLNYVLQLLDRYHLDVEIKGGYRPLLATSIIITTNNHPRLWYDYARREEQYNALARRFTGVFYFTREDYFPVEPQYFFDVWAEGCDEVALFVDTQPI